MANRGRPKGHKLSRDSRRKISRSKTGQKHTKETKKKISDSVRDYYAHAGVYRKGSGMPGKKLKPGNYPQSPAVFSHWNTGGWKIHKLAKDHNQVIKEVRLMEITYKHDQDKEWLYNLFPESDVYRLPGTMGASFERVTIQSKISLGNIDVTPENMKKKELEIRELLRDRYSLEDWDSKDRLLLTHMIFEKDGVPCRWDLAEKGKNGLVMVLTRIGKDPVNKLDLATAQSFAEGISDTLCEAKGIFKPPSEGTACPYSNIEIRLK